MWFYFVTPSHNLTSSRIVLNVRVRKAKDLGGHKTLAVKESKRIILTRIHPMERIRGHGLPLSLVYASPSRLRFRPYTAIEHQKFTRMLFSLCNVSGGLMSFGFPPFRRYTRDEAH